MSEIEFQMPKNQNSIIKVIGVGGGGGNAVNNMFLKGINGVDFVIANTDVQALDMSPIPNKIRLGSSRTEGLGAGANPEIGRMAALESIEDLREILKHNTKMVFVTAGMGGGTGTGAAPVIASLAKEMGILTVAIVTTPFRFEGKKRMAQALEGIRTLEKSVDTILVINNDNLTQIFGQAVTMKKAFEEADTVLCDAAKGIAEIITLEGYINVDFADVQTIMKDGGTALMGTATFSGEDRAIRAAEEAISSPLLDNVNIHGSRGILVNITASADSLRLDETTTIVEYIQEAAGDDADIIFGTVYDEELGDRLSVTVIATGFDKGEESIQAQAGGKTDRKQTNKEEFSISSSLDTFSLEEETERSNPNQNRERERDRELERQTERQRAYSAEEAELRARQRELEERLRKLRAAEYDYHNPDKLKGLEDEPAYLRKNKNVEDTHEDESRYKMSRLSLDEVDENRYELNDQNSFLFDNVD